MQDTQITKDGDIVTITTTVHQVEVIDLAELRQQLASLEDIPEPTAQEVLEMVKSGQEVFYYSQSRLLGIEEIKRKIQELEELIEE
jgi:ERCC4-type nuclease